MRPRHLSLLTIPIMGCCALLAITQQRTDQMGTVHSPISCRAESQAAFNRALSLLPAAWVQEARNGFAVLTETDPDCAMAYWGVAIGLLANPPQRPLTPDALRRG